MGDKQNTPELKFYLIDLQVALDQVSFFEFF